MSVPTTTVDAAAGLQLVLALITIARRLKARRPDGRLDPGAVFVLHHVLAGGPLRLSELAKGMGLDSSTVSRHVRHLEDLGYLARTGDPDDKRASHVRLTDAGRTILDQAMQARAAIVDTALAGWSAEDRDALTSLMTRLASSIDRLPAETETR
jgi:DNA-binding MarR family transcriptional regulator